MFPYKLHHNLLQTIISFQRWVVEYGLIARGAAMDLRSITSIQAHLDKLSLDDISYEYIASHFIPCMLLRIFLLNLCVVTNCMESLGRC